MSQAQAVDRRGSESRAAIRCPACGLVQFWREGKERCVRCAVRIGYAAARLEIVEEAGAGEAAQDGFDMAALATRLRALREARWLTRTEVSRKIKSFRTYVYKIEENRVMPGITTLRKLSDALGVTVAELLDERFTVEDLTQRSREALREREAFVAEIAALLPGIEPHDLRVLLDMASALAAGQYALPEWMRG